MKHSENHHPLTVLQVLPALDGGGVELTTVEVNRAIARRGHRSLVLSAGGPLVQSIERDGGEHIPFDVGKKSPATLLKIPRLRRLITEYDVDVLNVRSRMPAWVTYLAWRGMQAHQRPRLITTVHGLNSVNWYSRVMTYGENVVAVSQWCRDYILKNYPETDPQRISVIHAGIDSNDFPFGYRPNMSWLEAWYCEYPQLVDRFVVLLPGRLTRVKGHFDFINVIKKLKVGGYPVHGLIVGGMDPRKKNYAASITNEIAQQGLDADITLAGKRTDMREVMSVCDVVVSTTAHPPESFGRTTLEAVRLGRPTIGYDHGGVHEVLEKTYPQGLVPPKDVDAMVKKIICVRRNTLPPPTVTSEFDLQTMLDLELDLYEKVA